MSQIYSYTYIHIERDRNRVLRCRQFYLNHCSLFSTSYLLEWYQTLNVGGIRQRHERNNEHWAGMSGVKEQRRQIRIFVLSQISSFYWKHKHWNHKIGNKNYLRSNILHRIEYQRTFIHGIILDNSLRVVRSRAHHCTARPFQINWIIWCWVTNRHSHLVQLTECMHSQSNISPMFHCDLMVMMMTQSP